MINRPVRMTQDQTIVDRNNRVICLLCWKNDVDHVRRQEEIGREIVGLINSDVPQELENTLSNEPIEKKRGRSFGWRKEK